MRKLTLLFLIIIQAFTVKPSLYDDLVLLKVQLQKLQSSISERPPKMAGINKSQSNVPQPVLQPRGLSMEEWFEKKEVEKWYRDNPYAGFKEVLNKAINDAVDNKVLFNIEGPLDNRNLFRAVRNLNVVAKIARLQFSDIPDVFIRYTGERDEFNYGEFGYVPSTYNTIAHFVDRLVDQNKLVRDSINFIIQYIQYNISKIVQNRTNFLAKPDGESYYNSWAEVLEDRLPLFALNRIYDVLWKDTIAITPITVPHASFSNLAYLGDKNIGVWDTASRSYFLLSDLGLQALSEDIQEIIAHKYLLFGKLKYVIKNGTLQKGDTVVEDITVSNASRLYYIDQQTIAIISDNKVELFNIETNKITHTLQSPAQLPQPISPDTFNVSLSTLGSIVKLAPDTLVITSTQDPQNVIYRWNFKEGTLATYYPKDKMFPNVVIVDENTIAFLNPQRELIFFEMQKNSNIFKQTKVRNVEGWYMGKLCDHIILHNGQQSLRPGSAREITIINPKNFYISKLRLPVELTYLRQFSDNQILATTRERDKLLLLSMSGCNLSFAGLLQAINTAAQKNQI